MKISETDLLKDQFCGKILHLICRRSKCSWYFAYDPEGVVSSCSVSVSLDSPYREATLDGKVFAMIADQDDPQLSLLRSAAMLETQSVYGPNQTVWGATLGDGLVTSRMYSLFDGRTFMSKCDRARFGVYKNEWVPIYRLAYYYSGVRNASVHYVLKKSGINVTVPIDVNSQWIDPFRSSLPKNEELIIFERKPSAQGFVWIYNVPSKMIQMDGPAMTRLGKVGYFSLPQVPSNTTNVTDLYHDWISLHGPIDPQGICGFCQRVR